MKLTYNGKKEEKKVYSSVKSCQLRSLSGYPKSISKLIKGDNLQVMKHLLEEKNMENAIDLVYIDPPFATSNIFRVSEEKASTISHSFSDSVAYADSIIGEEYLEFIRERLILIRHLMSEQASIYLHIDYKIGHYVKILMDEIFGKENFINDLTRIKCNPKNFKRKAYGNIKDMVLFYSKNVGKQIWNDPFLPQTEEEINRLFKKVDSKGRRYTTIPLHAPGETKDGPTSQEWKGNKPPKGRHWRSRPEILDELDMNGLIEWSKTGNPRKIIYVDGKKGKRVQDVLLFKDSQNLSYPTQKNLALLKLFIATSSNPNSLVLDCFCGSGTTLKAAQELGRNWIGIDYSKKAIEIAQQRLANSQKSSEHLKIDFELLEQIE